MADESVRRPLVVDANILMAALVRDGLTRHLLLSPDLELHAPEVLWEELDRNRRYLLGKSGATSAAFDLLLDLLKSKIRPVPLEALAVRIDEALHRLGPANRSDAPYLAAALAIGATLWTHDKKLAKRSGVRAVTTETVSHWLEQ